MISWRNAPSSPAAALMGVLALGLGLAAPARGEPAFFQARVAPILDRHCTGCHGDSKQKAGLRLDSHEALMLGAESGAVLKPGDAKASEIIRRITLPDDDEDLMPSEGKPRLSADEIKVIELWIAGGASSTKVLGEFLGVPIAARAKPPAIALVADWRPRAAEIAALQTALGVKLVPRSQVPTDGLVLRTASVPARGNDAALTGLAPVADLIVEAELARTKVTDAGLASLATYGNLLKLDLSQTGVTSAGMATLLRLQKLETLNLTGTSVDAEGAAQLKALPALRNVWLFGTPAFEESPADPPGTK